MESKGAIELSLGFIVMIVFAVVLLSLAIVWVRGMMEGIGGLTESQIANAEAELADVFDQQQTVFALSTKRIANPPAERNKPYAVAVGFKNNLDSEKLNEDNIAYFGVEVTAIGGPDTDKLETYQEWISCVPSDYIEVEKGDVPGKIMCTFRADQTADAGTYSYKFKACTSTEPITDNCASEPMFGGAPQILQVVVGM